MTPKVGAEMYLSEEFTSASWSPLPPLNLIKAMGGEQAAGERYIIALIDWSS